MFAAAFNLTKLKDEEEELFIVYFINYTATFILF